MNRTLTFAFPGRLDLNTGGYAYDRRVIAGLPARGWSVTPLSLGEGFPAPEDAALADAEAMLSDLPDGSIVLVDGLAFGVMDRWAAREARRLSIVALVHHPLALETGLTEEQTRSLRERERAALSHARHVVVTSPMTARELVHGYDVPERAITVALPGTDRAPRSAGSGEVPLILSVGTLTRRKGHDVLLQALKQIEDLPWRASIIGSRDLDPKTATELERQLARLGLTGRVTLEGERADTRPAFAQADIFALATRYEGYGMVFAEALSQGLPIVSCQAGAVPEVVPSSAGLLVPVDDVDAFAGALRHLVSKSDERRRYADGAWQAGQALPGWDDTCATIARVLEESL